MAVESQVPKILGVCILMTILSTSVVFLRFLSRHISKIGYEWDDWVSLICLPFVLATNIILLVNTRNGLGYHVTDGPPHSLLYFEITIYAIEILYSIAVGLIKISVILFYHRIFRVTNQKFIITLWIIGAITTIWTLGIVFASVFQCTPLPAGWDPNVSGNCLDLTAFFLGQAIPDVLLDLALLILPVPILWKLHMENVKKAGLILVFILGYIVPIVSVLRIVYIAQIYSVVDVVSEDDSTTTAGLDLTWDYVDCALWTTVEASLGLISISIPALYHLFKLAAQRAGLLKSRISERSWFSKSKSRSIGRRRSRNSLTGLTGLTGLTLDGNDSQQIGRASPGTEDFPLDAYGSRDGT